jgi:hypothetical protein
LARTKVALTERELSIVSVQVAPVEPSQPAKPWKR